jgi:4-hydroxybenzoate polyprenyltransferase
MIKITSAEFIKSAVCTSGYSIIRLPDYDIDRIRNRKDSIWIYCIYLFKISE